MLNVCTNCGLYRPDKEIDPAGPDAICPECGHRHRFVYLPVMFVSGPSCAGKSTVCQLLMGRYTDAVLLDGDILWRDEFNSPKNGGVSGFFDMWLRVAKNIGQSGRPVVVFNAGATPDNVVNCVEARYFSSLHFLSMVCEAGELERRLKARPEWRGSGREPFIAQQIGFDNWIRANGQKDGRNITLVDSSVHSEDETARLVADWISGCIQESSG